MKRRSGFTLLELLTVMVIVFILMGMGTVAIRGMVRGGGIRGASQVVRSVLSQARQISIMKRKDVYVIFRSDGEVNGISLYAPYGECHAPSDGGKTITLVDDLPWPTGTLVNAQVFNLTESLNDEKGVFAVVDEHETTKALSFNSNNGQWHTEDIVGFELNAERFLPDSIKFKSAPAPIVFHAGGGLRYETSDVKIELEEKNVSGGGSITLKVDPLTGWVE
jgi:prepilin-type N-terminal cleavage/methylation domain-containing protein